MYDLLPRRSIRLILLSLLLLSLAACGSEPVQEDGGVLEPVAPEAPVSSDTSTDPQVALTAEASGNERFIVPVGIVTQNQSTEQALQMAVEEINSNGYLGDGRTFELVGADGSIDEMSEIYINLVSDPGVIALLFETESGIQIVLARPGDVDSDDFTATADFTVTESAPAAWNIANEDTANQRFVEGFRAMSGADPDLSAASAYSALYLLAESIRLADSTEPGPVIDAFRQIESFETPLGTLNGSTVE